MTLVVSGDNHVNYLGQVKRSELAERMFSLDCASVCVHAATGQLDSWGIKC